jgi:hypothetical protein
MSADLKDFRGKITARAWCCIEARHRATGKEHSEIVRDILTEWADVEHRVAIEQQKLLAAEGIAGNDGEEAGRSRK